MIKKYRIHITLHASTIVELEADNKEDAINKVLDNTAEPILCHQCSDAVQIDSINLDTKTWEVIEIKCK